MKKHAIIPIFIPHLGCPNDCIFCNQKKITAKQQAVSDEDVKNIIDTHLGTLQRRGLDEIEVSFFGGSFTGIPIEDQTKYLKIAYEYKKKGLVDKIHMSTRPDYINKEIMDNLAAYSVDVIELGVQTFDENVLAGLNRGHDVACVYRACDMIKSYGMELGIQLMVGLPGDTLETALYSAHETVKIHPQLARLYPTLVIKDTELYEMYKRGEYKPLEVEEAVEITKEMYKVLDEAGINVMRVGLKSTDIINENSDSLAGKTYHPAFRQLVEGRIARDLIEAHITDKTKSLTIMASDKDFNNCIGHQAENKRYFAEHYPNIEFRFILDNSIDAIKIE